MILKFRKNNSFTDNSYDLINQVSTDLETIKLSKPQKDPFTKDGATYILESWNDGIKILDTGLRPTDIPQRYTGSHINRYTGIALDLRVIVSHDLENIAIELKERAITTVGNSSYKKFRNAKGMQL